MSAGKSKAPEGPDFSEGIALDRIGDSEIVRGHVRGAPAVLVRQGEEVFALGASCTHYGAPLAEGLVVGDALRCPWHHAAFRLRDGTALHGPALDPLPCWSVAVRGGKAFAGAPVLGPRPSPRPPVASPSSVVIVGGGPAGHCAAETLRREGYEGRVTILSADTSVPCDRPNLSKGYLAGTAPEEWLPLRPARFYREHDIILVLGARVTRIDPAGRFVELDDGTTHMFGALLLATGAEPIRLGIPGADLPHVHYLRTLADAKTLSARAAEARRAVIVGAGFIGLEVASSLRTRGLEVDVVAREAVPMDRILGEEVGRFIQRTHERNGVRFHLGTEVAAIDEQAVNLATGAKLEADLVVVGIGVRPATALAADAGLEVDRGVIVDRYLQASEPGIYAAGDVARWPDPLTGELVRIEHFVVAERQGQAAARNILGHREPFEAVPFFWTEQFDLALAYVGHAAQWDEIEIEGDLETARRGKVTYRRSGRVLAVAAIHEDLAGLRAEVALERDIAGRASSCPRRAPASPD